MYVVFFLVLDQNSVSVSSVIFTGVELFIFYYYQFVLEFSQILILMCFNNNNNSNSNFIHTLSKLKVVLSLRNHYKYPVNIRTIY